MTPSLGSRLPQLPPVAGAVLESLFEHRLLSTAQLYAMHTPTSPDSRWIRVVLGDRGKQRVGLQGLGLVQSVGARWSQGRLWFLTEKGAEAIQDAGALQGRRWAPISPEGAAGQLQAHTLATNDVGVALMVWARRYDHDFGHLGWRNEVAHRIGEGRGGTRGGDLLVADALARYVAFEDGRALPLDWLVEGDRATEPVHELADKLCRYIRLHRFTAASGREPSVPDWRQRYPAFPKVVVVFAGKERRALRRRLHVMVGLCRRDPRLQATLEDVPVAFTLLEDLQARGPFADIFFEPAQPEGPVDVLGRPAEIGDALGSGQPAAGEVAALP